MIHTSTIFEDLRISYTTRDEGSVKKEDFPRVFQQKTVFVPILEHGARRIAATEYTLSGITADAAYTKEKDLALGITVADCVPVVLYDKKTHAFSIIHAGWKSLVQNIVELTIDDMQRVFGTQTKNIGVWIGPSLRKCCYLVNDLPFQNSLPSWKNFIEKEKNGYNIDLQGFISSDLQELGVERDSIIDTLRCTYHEAEYFFSYRRACENHEDKTERFGVCVWRE